MQDSIWKVRIIRLIVSDSQTRLASGSGNGLPVSIVCWMEFQQSSLIVSHDWNVLTTRDAHKGLIPRDRSMSESSKASLKLSNVTQSWRIKNTGLKKSNGSLSPNPIVFWQLAATVWLREQIVSLLPSSWRFLTVRLRLRKRQLWPKTPTTRDRLTLPFVWLPLVPNQQA